MPGLESSKYIGTKNAASFFANEGIFNPDGDSSLAFLDGMYASSEFAEYIVKANEISVFKRSYMEVSLNMFNPD